MKLQLLEKSKIFYHWSPCKLEYLKEGCDFTPYKELAIAFGSKPVSLSVDENNIYFNPSITTVYLYQVDETIIYNVDYYDRPRSSFEKGYELRTKRKIKIKLIKTIYDINEYIQGVTNESK